MVDYASVKQNRLQSAFWTLIHENRKNPVCPVRQKKPKSISDLPFKIETSKHVCKLPEINELLKPICQSGTQNPRKSGHIRWILMCRKEENRGGLMQLRGCHWAHKK